MPAAMIAWLICVFISRSAPVTEMPMALPRLRIRL
jgi:hypothetical protein